MEDAIEIKANPPFKKYTVPFARKLSPAEQSQVDYYRHLRESFNEGPYYSVLDASSSNAKKGSVARVNFDPFHGMPTYSGRYQKKRRTLPRIAGRSYGKLTNSWLTFSCKWLTSHV
jgi:DNA-directed RNA polymerase III subunit RPC7